MHLSKELAYLAPLTLNLKKLSLAVSVAGKVAVKKLSKANISYQMVFWISLALIASLMTDTNQPFLIDFGLELMVISFYAIIVYFNYYYLFPIYVKQKNSACTCFG